MRPIYMLPIATLILAACELEPDNGRHGKPAGQVVSSPQDGGVSTTSKTTENVLVAAKPGACMTQDGKPLMVQSLRALGTEPFWGAQVEGRCVTYSHPEDQKGTRVWTRYTATADGGRWSGALGGREFELITRKVAECSDGMSDNKFPMAVELMVNGDKRLGCAE